MGRDRQRLHGPLPERLAFLSRDELQVEVGRAKAEIDRAYWTFTRTARGSPPPGHLYEIERWAKEALWRAR